MSYTVLARRYRSQDFDDLIGQEPIAQTLRNAIETNRVAHAYLFCGTRGVGKTSTARILAKALNCEKGPTAKPCGTCDRCRSIAAGEDLDVVEIDGASNNGVEDVRNLRSNVIYRPARSPYKVYIIDEVHMLSGSAFNALLKTLEEPPSHVKFIFATTEPNKVPQTISSRCQQFNFRLIPTKLIAGRLADILKTEKIKASEEVVQRVARAGRGSMRDALSLMDQLLSMGADKIAETQVDYLLGEPAGEQLLALAGALADGDPAAALRRTDQLLASGYAPEQFVVALIEHFRRLALLAVVGGDCEFVEVGLAERPPLVEQARRFSPLTAVYVIQVLEQLRQSVRATTSAARALIDAAVVRLALLEQFADTAELVERLAGSGAGAGTGGASGPARAGAEDAKKKFPPAVGAQPGEPADSPAAASPAPAPVESPPGNGRGPDLGPPLLAADTPLEQAAGDELWNTLIGRISQARLLTLAGPLAMTRLLGADGSTLRVSARADLVRVLAAPQRQEQLHAALGQLLGRAVRIEWVGAPEPAGVTAGGPARVGGAGGGYPGASAMHNGGDAGRPSNAAGRLSQQEVDQVVADPAVRQVLDLFDATVVNVERKLRVEN